MKRQFFVFEYSSVFRDLNRCEDEHDDIESRMNIKRRDLDGFVMVESNRLRNDMNLKLSVDN